MKKLIITLLFIISAAAINLLFIGDDNKLAGLILQFLVIIAILMWQKTSYKLEQEKRKNINE